MTRVLVVDDEPSNLELVSEFLVLEGHEVARAACGREARALLDTGAIDLLITDLHMPSPDGFGLVEHVRSLACPVPVVMMSGTWTAEERRRAGALGIARLHDKPLDPEQLLRDVGELASLCPPRSCRARETPSPGQQA